MEKTQRSVTKIYISLFLSWGDRNFCCTRERERERERERKTGRRRRTEDLKGLNTDPFFLTTLCHTQIQGRTSFLRRDVLNRSSPGGYLAPCGHSGTSRLKTETEDFCRLPHPLLGGAQQLLSVTDRFSGIPVYI